MSLLSYKKESHTNVLKIVHPGGFVEIHTNPIMASEVMKKNPRHCVTRPDIFRFPWIVVSPEAILRPGKVFYIVPCHTIRHLLKSSTASSSTTNRDRDRDRCESFYVDQDCHRRHNKISNSKKIKKQQTLVSPSVPYMKLRKEGDKGHSYYSSEYYYDSHDVGRERDWISSGLSHHSEKVPMLKSCLKKDNKSHNARSRNLKVRFACNHEEVNKT